MSKVTRIAAAVALVAALAGCGGSISAVRVNGNVEVTAKTASKESSVESDFEVAENQHVVVDSEITKGGIAFQMVRDNEASPAVEWTFEETGETEYDVTPGNYKMTFTSVQDKTEGKLTVKLVEAEGHAEPYPESGDQAQSEQSQETTDTTATAQTEEAGQNPVMNFVGNYAADRCSILVECEGKEDAKFTVHWGSSASESSEWVMSGKLDAETMTVNYTDCVKKDVVYKEDGSVDKETVVYEDGTGTIKFSTDSKLTWNDEKEHAADNMVFEYSN